MDFQEEQMGNKDDRIYRPARSGVFFACFLAATLPAGISYAENGPPLQLTLTQALEQAFRASPVIQAREAEVRQAEARLLGARTYPFNPELEVGAGDRQGPVEASTDRELLISQEIEIGGQRGKRIAVATADLEAVRSGFRREQRLLTARVQLAFAETLRSLELLRIAEADAELTRQLLDFAVRRLDAGAATQVELNLARSTAGQSERALRLAQSDYEAARNLLVEVVGLTTDQALEPVGTLPQPEAQLAPLGELVASALENRSDLAALRKATESAREAIRLSRSLAIPNLRLGAFYEEEEGTEEIKGIGLSLPIPLFNRNQGEVAEAQAETERLTAEGSAAELAIRREVADAVASYRAAQQAAGALRDLVVGTLEENLAFLQRALEAGKISATDVLVFRREFVEGQRQFIETLSEAWAARIILDLATGHTAIPDTATQESLP